MRFEEDLVWWVPEEHGGIRTYSEELWPSVVAAHSGQRCQLIERPFGDREHVIKELIAASPRLIHFQHEYDLFGSKVPGRYGFPSLIEELRRVLPQTKMVATAHTVLGKDYRYPLRGRSWQIPLRALVNQFALPMLRRLWNDQTWGPLDGVVVHSELQRETIQGSGVDPVVVIPHFVSPAPSLGSSSDSMADSDEDALRALAEVRSGRSVVAVMGFISPEKGQDLAIRALSRMQEEAHLFLGGGLRRKEDQGYLDYCRSEIRRLEISDRVTVTGFLSSSAMQELYRQSAVVILPFWETTGSGSLARAMAYGSPVVASDLKLNREIDERVPGCLEFFRRGDAEDLALRLDELLESSDRRRALQEAAKKVSQQFSPEKMAQAHQAFYQQILRD